jgi:hypothetical protein
LLDDVAPDDVFGGGGAEKVLDLGVCELLLQVEAVEVAHEEVADGGHVFGLHGTETLSRSLGR